MHCGCDKSVNHDMVEWWLSNEGDKLAREKIRSIDLAELGTSETMRDHDVGKIVLEKWPNWFFELETAIKKELESNSLAKHVVGRFNLREYACKTYLAGRVGALAKCVHGDALKELVAGNRMVRKVQEA